MPHNFFGNDLHGGNYRRMASDSQTKGNKWAFPHISPLLKFFQPRSFRLDISPPALYFDFGFHNCFQFNATNVL
jgi:hypothetical protein